MDAAIGRSKDNTYILPKFAAHVSVVNTPPQLTAQAKEPVLQQDVFSTTLKFIPKDPNEEVRATVFANDCCLWVVGANSSTNQPFNRIVVSVEDVNTTPSPTSVYHGVPVALPVLPDKHFFNEVYLRVGAPRAVH